jgi:ATP-binding cassette, subfamily D (ALD), peroxisomal long-chain fatty acid import protein
LDGGVGLSADHYITSDLIQFSNAAAHLVSSLGKPAVDLVLTNWELSKSLGLRVQLTAAIIYSMTFFALKRRAPPFTRFKSAEATREGEFRRLHSRIIANAEEIAFYGGELIEKAALTKEFVQLRRLMNHIYRLKIRTNMMESFVIKYCFSALGYMASAFPVFFSSWGGRRTSSGDDNRMGDFVSNQRLMLGVSDAGGRLMAAIGDLPNLAGYTSRMWTLLAALHRVDANAYKSKGRDFEAYSLADVQGTMQRGFDGVRLENVPIVAPSLWPNGGEELIESLSLVVRDGSHLLVSKRSQPATARALLTRLRFLARMGWARPPLPASLQACGRYTEA